MRLARTAGDYEYELNTFKSLLVAKYQSSFDESAYDICLQRKLHPISSSSSFYASVVICRSDGTT